MRRLQHELVPPLVGHSDHRRVDAEQLDDRPHDRVEGRLERERLRERARDLVEGVELASGLSL